MTCLLHCVAVSSLLALQPAADSGRVHLEKLRDALQLRQEGRSHDAGAVLERLLEATDLHPATKLRSVNGLGLIRRDQGRWSEAAVLFEGALRSLPLAAADCALYPAVTGNLGEVRLQQGQLREARSLFQRALDLARSCPENDVFASLQMLNLSGLARMQGDYPLAKRLARNAHRHLVTRLGETHPHSILALNNLAQVYGAQRNGRAIQLMETVKERTLQVHGERHPLYSGVLSNLGVAYYERRQYQRAEALLRQALQIDEKTYGPGHPSVARDLKNLAAVLDSTQRTDEAEFLLRKVIDASRVNGAPDARAMASLGTIQLVHGRVDEAARWFSEVSQLVRGGQVAPEPDLAKRLEQFALALRALNRPADAERYQAEATRLRTRAVIDIEALRALNYSEFWKGNRQ